MNQIEPEKENLLAPSLGPANRKVAVSRSIKLKLFALVGTLLVVMIMMKEAGKPENWAWMGFEKNNQPALEADASAIVFEPGLKREGSSEESSEMGDSSSSIGLTTTKSNGQLQAISSVPGKLVFDQGADYPTAAATFWVKTFPRMQQGQKKSFYQLLRRIRESKTNIPDQKGDFESLVDWIEIERTKFHTQLLGEVSVMSEKNPSRRLKSAELKNSQDLWRDTELPILSAASVGEDFQVAQQLRISKLQRLLDPVILDDVTDMSAVGRAKDLVAWWRTWERAGQLKTADLDSAEAVSPFQLRAQPAAFRGKLVSLDGKIKTARLKPVGSSQLGFENITEMWVEPIASRDLVCVYAINPPDGFPELTADYQDLNESVSIAGYFFKSRSYRDAEEKARHCPLILANSFQSRSEPQVATVVPTKSQFPSTSTFTLILFGLGICATVLAWRVYRGYEYRSYQPRGKSVERIEKSLQGLAGDQNIKSDADKVRELYDET